jgi:hypothetical protein
VDVGLNQGTGSNYGTYHLLTPAARNSCSWQLLMTATRDSC